MPIPPADHLGAVTRGLHTVERDGQPMKVLTAERTYPALPEEVWDAITDPERIPRWIGGAVTGDLRLGGRYQIEGNAGGEILECEPPKRLALTWEYDGSHAGWTPPWCRSATAPCSTSSTPRPFRPRCGRSSVRARSGSAGSRC